MAKRRGNGEGCIYRYRNGWAGVVTDGTNPATGKPNRKFVYGKTRKEVSDKVQALTHQQSTGGIIDAGKLNVATWLDIWVESYVKPNLRPSTYTSYRHLIDCHIVPEMGGLLLKRVTTTDIQILYTSLLDHGNKAKVQDPETGEMIARGGGLSPTTVLYIHRILKAALEQAKEEKKIAVNPAASARPPQAEKKEQHVLSQEQVGIFLDRSKKYRYYGAYYLGASSGMRRGEVLGLKWEYVYLNMYDPKPWSELDKVIPWSEFDDVAPWDVERVAEILTAADIAYETPVVQIKYQLSLVNGKAVISEPKTDNSKRYVDIPPLTACALVYQRYLQRREADIAEFDYNADNLVFCTTTGNHVPPRSFTRNFQGAVKHAGLQKIRFHDLRHTVATILLEEGAPLNMVQELLGHHDPAFTADTYGHVTKRMRSQASTIIGNTLVAARAKDEHATERP